MEYDIAPAISLVVIRSRDLAASVEFYSALGFEFNEEQHEYGPVHYVAELEDWVFEIYPFDGSISSTGTRLGFRVTSINNILVALGETTKVIRAPFNHSDDDSHRPLSAVIEDPDGHKIELVQYKY